MNPLKQLGEVLTDGDFWLHAGAVLVGFKASDMINAIAAKTFPSIPDAVQPFVGPTVVILAAPFLGKKFGPYLMVGAGLNVVDSLLGMIGVPQGSIRSE